MFEFGMSKIWDMDLMRLEILGIHSHDISVIVESRSDNQHFKFRIHASSTQLIEVLHFICKGRGSNPGHSTSLQLNCVSSSH